MPDHIHEEVGYAAGLLQRAEKAINDELRILDAAGVSFDRTAALHVCSGLVRLYGGLRLLHLQSLEARA